MNTSFPSSLGTYKVRVEHSGFKRVERTNVEVRISERIPVNIQLEIGAVSETVNVSAQASILETASASMGQVIDSKHIRSCP